MKNKLISSFWYAEAVRRFKKGNKSGGMSAMSQHFASAPRLSSISYATRATMALLIDQYDAARDDFAAAQSLAETEGGDDGEYVRKYSAFYRSVMDGRDNESRTLWAELKTTNATRFARRVLPLDFDEAEPWPTQSR